MRCQDYNYFRFLQFSLIPNYFDFKNRIPDDATRITERPI